MYNQEQIIKKFRDIHGDKYDYSKVEYITMHDKVCIKCSEHGDFYQEPRSHIKGQGCPICGNIKRAKSKTDSLNEFIEKAQKKHGLKYKYDEVVYVNNLTKIKVKCSKHGIFLIRPDMLLQGHGCPECKKETLSLKNKRTNNILQQIISYIQGIDNTLKYEIIDSSRVFYPKHSIAIRVLEINKDNEVKYPNRKHHVQYNESYEERNEQIIQIYDDEWINKQEICKSRLCNIFGKNMIKIYARKCQIKEIDNSTGKLFCNQNHIQGGVNSLINLGLFYEDMLISVMTFGNLRKNMGSTKQEGRFELLRFCTKSNLSVIGGASKLFKFFIKKYKPLDILSYADRRWSVGNVYTLLGFTYVKKTEPNYFYIIDGVRKNRFSFRKDVLITKYGCSPSDNEHNFCRSQGWYRIYDCGCKVFLWQNNIYLKDNLYESDN